MQTRWESQFTPEGLRQHVVSFPGMAWRIPGDAGYAVAAPWNGRREIAQILEVLSARRRAALFEVLLSALRDGGARLALLSHEEQGRALDSTDGIQWEPLEEVFVYRRGPEPLPDVRNRLDIVALDGRLLSGLLEVEEGAFAWMWRFGSGFFAQGDTSPNRRLRIAVDGGFVAGYYVVVAHRRFGHIDRLAVHPRYQFRGYGKMLLARALGELTDMGCRETGLSTQSGNRVAQRLYEGFGFRRTGSYRIHGKWLAGPEAGHEPRRGSSGPLSTDSSLRA